VLAFRLYRWTVDTMHDPTNLDMLASETIRPAILNPENYAENAKRFTWHGYYAFRRGIATLASQSPAIRWQPRACSVIPA
jgi:hypothetical protein